MFLDFYVIFYMFACGLLVFVSMRKHLLLTLLSIEFLVLVLFFSIFIFLFSLGHGYCFLLVFLSFSVCEGVLGLSILVSMIRCHGNDNVMSLSSLMW
uniref:NADH-ubiquinone oxidoreductase chain 4L n=2 Tax=Leptopodidae TaxID=236428 RepID=A0A8T9ZVZ8_9HEMI|nr:NADH dehydrogenase subunit 4L [Leptopus sp. NKMT019]UPL65204.1 NADH dehydrogenase subunit 4L [Valleriola javanica]